MHLLFDLIVLVFAALGLYFVSSALMFVAKALFAATILALFIITIRRILRKE